MSKSLETFSTEFATAYGKGDAARASAAVIAYRAATEHDEKHADIGARFSRAIEASGSLAPKGTAYVSQMINGVTAVMIVGALPTKLTPDAVVAIQTATSASAGRITRDTLAGIADRYKLSADYSGFASAVKSAIKDSEELKRAEREERKSTPLTTPDALADAVMADEEFHGDVSTLADLRAVIARAGKLLDILADNTTEESADEYAAALTLVEGFAKKYATV